MKNNHTGMTLIVKTITRITVGLILIYGIYIVLQGHISPGGGFAGGVIIALSFIHLLLAFGKDAVLSKISQVRGVTLAGIGALAFLLVAGSRRVTHGHSLDPQRQLRIFDAWPIPLCDIAIALMVGMALLVIFLSLVLLTGRPEKE